MLLGMDEFPFHQITDTFAAVAGSDQSWNDGHYVCAADQAGNVALTSNVRLYANTDVLDGFVVAAGERDPLGSRPRNPGGLMRMPFRREREAVFRRSSRRCVGCVRCLACHS